MSRASRFDREQVALAGLEVVRLSGWEKVSTRSISAALGVSPMALYRLVDDAEELRVLVADAAADELQPLRAASLEESLRIWALRAYETLDTLPGLATFVLLHWTELPGWLEIVDELLSIANQHGIEGSVAVARVNAVFAYVLSRAQLRESVHVAPSRSLHLLVQHPDRYAFIRANQGEFLVARSDRHFRFGLDGLLAGLQAIG
jgi:AcrR family transcriptional regulator